MLRFFELSPKSARSSCLPRTYQHTQQTTQHNAFKKKPPRDSLSGLFNCLRRQTSNVYATTGRHSSAVRIVEISHAHFECDYLRNPSLSISAR